MVYAVAFFHRMFVKQQEKERETMMREHCLQDTVLSKK